MTERVNHNVDIEIDLDVLARKLIADPKFIRLVSEVVRRQMLTMARNYGNLWGKWGTGR